MSKDNPIEIECVGCGGFGCALCDNGFVIVDQCPMQVIGGELIEDISIVAACEDGVLPVSGGLLDQPAYYHELSTALANETNNIEREQSERRIKHA